VFIIISLLTIMLVSYGAYYVLC